VRRVFLDTSFHAALIDRRDNSHQTAIEAGRQMAAARDQAVTTEIVLIELLTSSRTAVQVSEQR
jgi:predicted nucleic acid-binding protein